MDGKSVFFCQCNDLRHFTPLCLLCVHQTGGQDINEYVQSPRLWDPSPSEKVPAVAVLPHHKLGVFCRVFKSCVGYSENVTELTEVGQGVGSVTELDRMHWVWGHVVTLSAGGLTIPARLYRLGQPYAQVISFSYRH